MRVLVACEFTGRVRDAFTRLGHAAVSCDLLPTEVPGEHIQGDVRDVLGDGWDMLIAHPPCTHLATSGARWFGMKKALGLQREALDFFLAMLNAPVPMICVENPMGIASTHICPPTQVVQPYQFGHADMKTTWLWLKNLPKLRPTKIVKPERVVGRNGKMYSAWSYRTFNAPKEQRAAERSRTFEGIAQAMAEQWGRLPTTYRTGFDLPYRYALRNLDRLESR